jgi:hypothetical protein
VSSTREAGVRVGVGLFDIIWVYLFTPSFTL